LRALVDGGWVSVGGVVVLEESEAVAVGDVAGLTLVDTRVYGAACVRIYRRD
jgi:16S rRNA G966 N2-methylase RsmD